VPVRQERRCRLEAAH